MLGLRRCVADEFIIDCHCHAGPWRRAHRALGHGGAARRLPAPRGSGGDPKDGPVLPAFIQTTRRRTSRWRGSSRAKPERFLGFVFVNGQGDRGRMMRLVERFVLGYGFRGIKLHRYDTRISRETCRAARAFGIPVLYDVMGEVSCVHLLAEEYPDVDFIIPHLGSFADDWAAQKAFIPSLARYPNIYTDTSGVRRFDLLVEALRAAGPHKVLFGSDGPWLHPGVELAKVRALGLPPAAERLVLAGNLRRLLGRSRTSRRRLSRRADPGPVRHGVWLRIPVARSAVSAARDRSRPTVVPPDADFRPRIERQANGAVGGLASDLFEARSVTQRPLGSRARGDRPANLNPHRRSQDDLRPRDRPE